MEQGAMESVDVCLGDLSHNKMMMALVEHYSSIPDQDLAVSWFSTSEDLNCEPVRATPHPSVANRWSYEERSFGLDARDIFDTQIPHVNQSFPTFDAYATPETENPMARPTNGNTQPHAQGLVPEICLIPDSRSGVSTPEPLLTFNMSTPSDIDSFLSISNLPAFDDATSLLSESPFYPLGPATPVSLTASYHCQNDLTAMVKEQPVIEYHTPSDFLQDLDDAFAETETCQPPAMTVHDRVGVPRAPEAAVEPTPAFSGPVTKDWKLPPRIQRRKKVKPLQNNNGVSKPKPEPSQGSKARTKRRGPYTDESMRQNTALTRVLKSCIRCRMNRGRCNPDPSDLDGPCLTCKRITGPTLCKMPCYRYIVTDASLYREQKRPSFSHRWQSMDIIDITASDWASPDIRTIVVSPVHVDAPFEFRVRKFNPVEGDVVHEMWKTPQGMKQVALPRYALAEMHEAGKTLKAYIETSVSKFIVATVGHLDTIFWETYGMAFRHINEANTEQERSLMSNVFRLWVVCRLTSNPVFIRGPETLDGNPINDPESKYFGRVPMPKIMTAQFECIEYTNFLRPWSKAVLKQLNDLVLAKKREYWFTIYLALFVLLHSCSMVTRRDAETARKWGMRNEYANPESIKAHHAGAQTMLAHFHFINKGVLPFDIPHDEAGRHELSKAASLSEEQLNFVWKTGDIIKDPVRVTRMKHVRERFDVGDDFYWISMLYDREWKPLGND
ncbi:hypothetical protein QBC45DRAFT_448642 [Copromyces sp. CBS 386.78]|nr:hypothetical protein QBC45DRAFT_448642 [Copromyces sp. CBS 386.78]